MKKERIKWKRKIIKEKREWELRNERLCILAFPLLYLFLYIFKFSFSMYLLTRRGEDG
jgi:hypothetical protein